MRKLIIGEVSSSGNVLIMDEDRLCYLVKNTSKGAQGLRTISKKLLEEFVNYIGKHPDATANEAREELAGNSQIDKFEYGYAATLVTMAKMVIDESTLASPSSKLVEPEKNDAPLQQIFYGAPGTGKSHAIKELTKGAEVIRTTFHPDSDYSTFVGAYKPTTKSELKYTAYGEKAVIIKDADGNPIYEDKIVYEFVSQAFLQAYVNAWKQYARAQDGETPKEQFLVIEEINRGNCAQIFGDLFQLLDRNGCGFSDYPIKADNDMKKQLAKTFAGLEITQRDKINSLYKDNEKDIVGQVLSGEKLLLPNNLYIWATMNTSDQSLFPIDSAFKRRWDWQYMPIGKGYDNNGNEYKWYIEIAGKKYSWWSFLEKINAQIAEATQSEDKKLGFFFCKAEDNKISADKFVGKVIFYLWNDVFKDYGFEIEIFKDIDGTELSFAKFYRADVNGNAIIQEDKVEAFLHNLKVELLEDNTDEDINIPADDVDSNSIDYTKFSFDGSSNLSKKALGEAIVIKYLAQNQDLPFDRISEIFDFASMVDKQHQYKGVVAKSSDITGSYLPCYGEERLSNDNVSFKILTWWNKYNIDYIINFAKQQGWEVTKMSK